MARFALLFIHMLMAHVCLKLDSRVVGLSDVHEPADRRPLRERPSNPEFLDIPECGRQPTGRQDDKLLMLCVCAEELCYKTKDWDECLACRNTCNPVPFQLSCNRFFWEYVTQAGLECYDLSQEFNPIDCESCKLFHYVCPYGCSRET